jgi:hypothetical protein
MAGRSQPKPTAAVRERPAEPARPYPTWLVPLALLLLCTAAYANSFGVGFALDNRQLILRDPRVQAITGENVSRILTHSYWWPYGESGLYRPLTTFSYLFNYAVLGNAARPAGYHAVNLLLHGANVLLLWHLTRRLTRAEWTAAAAASLWAVLPLSTEAVTNIVGRADLMAATASLGSLVLYVRARAQAGAARVVSLTGVALLVAAGVLAKESAIAVLGIFVVYEALWWTRGRSVGTLVGTGGACLIPLGWWAWQRASVLAAGGAAEFPFTDNPLVAATTGQRLLTAVHVMWRYLTLLVWPARLSNDYSYAQVPLACGTTAEWLGAALLVGGAFAALWQARRHRTVVFFAAFAMIAFLPASNLLIVTGTIMGERLMYLPSAGLAVIAAVALHRAASTPRRLRAATIAVAVAVAAFGVRTYARNPDWTSDLTLWRSAVHASPASAKAHRALAEALYDADPTHANIDEVIAEADRSVALLEALADERNTFQAFRQAGAYYLDKASAVSARNSAEPELRRLYARALNLLDRAVLIARAGAAAIPGGSVEPEADAQRLRAAALLGLDNPSLSLVAAKRSRQLSPFNPLAYRLSASALIEAQRADEAAMTLMTGSIVSGDASLGQEVMALYANGLDPDGCAVSGSGASAALNPDCPTVHRHSCIASAAAYQILTAAARTDRAAQIRAAAVANLACPADLMDRPNSLVP